MTTFTLDPILEKDSFEIGALKLCTLRLMNDKRYPWIIMVPMRDGLTEIIDLTHQDRTLLMDEISQVCETLKALFTPHKLNIAALGNQVRQLHIHVIARQETDEAWPQPIWGIGETTSYSDEERKNIINMFALHPIV